MDDDFDNDMDLADDNLDESLGDLGDLAEAEVTLEVETEFDDTSTLGGTRSSGGARALTTTREPAASKAAAPKPAKKAAPKQAAPKKAAPKKAAKKKAAPKKKAKAAAKKTKSKSKPAKRKAGSKK